ncbi:MAG: glycosyltransferase family 2 protein [Deltaproteobacteria bacterium]|nr:glycosyltransferase family 2 protein [Deltaproteobacteria bacterium]
MMDDGAPSWQDLRARCEGGGAAFAFVIPVFNHARNVGQVAAAAAASGAAVIVVDDGSTDGSAAAASAVAGVRLVRHEANRGKGAAILTGLAAAQASGARFAITVDADGQHRPDEARRLLAALWPSGAAKPEAALVLGARRGMQGGAVPWSSRMGRGFSGFWVWASGGPRVSDSQSGFRVYPVAETLALPTRARRFEFEVEVLVRARRAGLPVREVPVSVAYDPPGGRVSHFRPWRDFGRNSATFTRLLFSRFLPRGKGTGHGA